MLATPIPIDPSRDIRAAHPQSDLSVINDKDQYQKFQKFQGCCFRIGTVMAAQIRSHELFEAQQLPVRNGRTAIALV
jgi:hypothetical protein